MSENFVLPTTYNPLLTPSCNEMIENMIGYRNDNYSTGHYNIIDVISFEVNELSNDDIFQTCLNLYGTDDVVSVIENHFNTKNFHNLWGLWLTTEKGVVEHYKGSKEGYELYAIPENALIISDISDEGALFVIDSHPETYRFK